MPFLVACHCTIFIVNLLFCYVTGKWISGSRHKVNSLALITPNWWYQTDGRWKSFGLQKGRYRNTKMKEIKEITAAKLNYREKNVWTSKKYNAVRYVHPHLSVRPCGRSVNVTNCGQSRVVHGSILCDSIQFNPSADWPNPTQPNTTNNEAYSLVVTYFYTQNLSLYYSFWSVSGRLYLSGRM